MSISVWIRLVILGNFLCNSTSFALGSSNELVTTSKPNQTQETIEIKIGFLVGSRRVTNERSYSRPAGKQLVHTFNFGIDKVNHQFFTSNIQHDQQQQQQTLIELTGSTPLATVTPTPTPTSLPRNDSKKLIRFVPVVAETFGNESESIKETIGLITKHRVNFIVGPQDTCQVESRLAAVFNVGMISHYCPQYLPGRASFQAPPLPHPPLTFIQTKPPHWKIVRRATTLVSKLLSAQNGQWYPQQLVLLYFKDLQPNPIGGGGGSNGRQPSAERRGNSGWPLNSSTTSSNRWPQDAQLANDAIQYKLIGELLEIELDQLFSSPSTKEPIGGSTKHQASARTAPPLTVLNWHTTFHYGFTKNPFRQVIRRHLFRQHQRGTNAAQAANSLSVANKSGQCSANLVAEKNQPPVLISSQTQQSKLSRTELASVGQQSRAPNSKAAIYIIVGHYYEHLGLMLALDELNLLGEQHQQQPNLSAEGLQSTMVVNQQESIVIGVDIEQYDERDDSLRFLRGLLMNERHRSSSDLDSIAVMYRHYMGVVPAKPTRTAEFLEDMRLHYNQTQAGYSPTLQQQQHPMQQNRFPDTDSGEKLPSSWLANQTTLDSIQLTGRLFQFIRLPIEAFYLYDSITLLASYFYDCLQYKQLTLAQCSDGRRAFEWFVNREYFSFVDQNLTKFDSQAQTNGHYTLITRKSISNNNNDSSDAEDVDFGLMPVGRFIESSNSDQAHEIELNVEAGEIDPVWLPFWCHVKHSNYSGCKNFTFLKSNIIEIDDERDSGPTDDPTTNRLVPVAVVVLSLIAFVWLLANYMYQAKLANGLLSIHTNQSVWFDERDEDHFLLIVHKFLMTPEILNNQMSFNINDEQQAIVDYPILLDNLRIEQSMVELHCHMFPFPSCKFVHWLTALHQLKEMMFQYHSSLGSDMVGVKCRSRSKTDKKCLKTTRSLLPKLGFGLAPNNEPTIADCTTINRGFFRTKHKGTATLRILLSKYKSINESFCNLGNLNNDNVVKLLGASLGHNGIGGCGGKIVHLMVERPDRGNLRDALNSLMETTDPKTKNTTEFRELVVLNSIYDLINGIEYLHKSTVQFHGELRVTNCMITCDWRLKLSGLHAFHLRRSLGNYELKNTVLNQELYLQGLIYSPPEVLANHNRRCSLSSDTLRLADFYSLAFIVYELLVGREPWSCLTHVTSSKLLIDRVQAESSFRPPLSHMETRVTSSPNIDPDAVQSLLRSCWSHSPDRRPQTVDLLRWKLDKAFNQFQSAKANGRLMKSYANLLEQVSILRKKNLEQERRQSTELRLRLLPESIVLKLYNNQCVPVQNYDCVSLCQFRFILAADEQRPLEQLNEILIQLDALIETYRKRIHLLDSQVDSSLRHMIFSGEPIFSLPAASAKKAPAAYDHCHLVASFALQLIDLTNKWRSKFNSCFQVKCGLHCGPVVGGVVFGGRILAGEPIQGASGLAPASSGDGSYLASSSSCFNSARYVIYGNTLQMADILESSCVTQRIQVSGEFRSQILKNLPASPLAQLPEVDEFGRVEDGGGSYGGVAVDGGGGGIRQDYVMIRREAKISSKTFGEFEAYWLLNGPRLTASQSIMLLSESTG